MPRPHHGSIFLPDDPPAGYQRIIRKEEHLSFDDVCLVDGLSTVDSRSQVSTMTHLPKGYSLALPVMTAAMDTVTSPEMSAAVTTQGGAIFHHRNQSVEARIDLLREFDQPCALNGVAVGADVTPDEVAAYMDAGATMIGLEVAHAYHTGVAEAVRRIGPFCQKHNILLMVGNFSSVEALKWLRKETGDLVDLVKVSQGGGSACTTRLVTGIGKPTFQATLDAAQTDYLVVADGGIRQSGDLAKALGAGAVIGMLGGMLSGTDEAPGDIIVGESGKKFKEFRGMASRDAKDNSKNVEGIATLVPYKGSVVPILSQIRDGLQSAIASCGFESLEDFRREAQFIRVSRASQIEATPHARLLQGGR